MKCNFNEVGTNSFRIGDEERNFTVEVIDPVDDYLEMMKNIFDFGMIRSYLKSYKALLNSLHGGLNLILPLPKNKFPNLSFLAPWPPYLFYLIVAFVSWKLLCNMFIINILGL